MGHWVIVNGNLKKNVSQKQVLEKDREIESAAFKWKITKNFQKKCRNHKTFFFLLYFSYKINNLMP